MNGIQQGSIGGPGGANRAQGPDAGRGPGGAERRRCEPSDSLELSALSRQLSVEREGTPERAERVAELKRGFEAGRYQPDPREVAASVIKDAFEWKGRA